MKKINYILQFAMAISVFTACKSSNTEYDASGSFEAIERVISSEANGKILNLNISEGQLLRAGDTIGNIDVTLLSLQSDQVKSSIDAISEKTNNPSAQIDVLNAQLKSQQGQTSALKQQISNLDKEIIRFQNLVNANAVPQKQLDDLTGQKLVLLDQLNSAQAQQGVIKSQIEATRSNVGTQNRGILSEVKPNQKRLALIEQQIKDGLIINDFNGTVTTQMAYNGEFTAMGKPLYKIADLSKITLRVYISGNQLPLIKLNQTVTVKTDDGKGGFKETKGTITWISSKAEFTPKTIQTKDERANLVYAIKVSVINDGSYKIGMYGEIKF